MADIDKPSKRKKTGAPPRKDEASVKNLDRPISSELEPLQFKVEPEFKKAYKIFAAESGLKMVDVLKASFELYRQQHPNL
jgi:hypothetical protein